MTPECCKRCQTVTADGRCNRADFRKCYKWRAWFGREWERIRKAADRTREKIKEREGST